MYRKPIATGSQYQAYPGLAVLLALLFAFWGSAVSAATVYKTVDEMGVVSYSDTPPPEEVPVEVWRLG